MICTEVYEPLSYQKTRLSLGLPLSGPSEYHREVATPVSPWLTGSCSPHSFSLAVPSSEGRSRPSQSGKNALYWSHAFILPLNPIYSWQVTLPVPPSKFTLSNYYVHSDYDFFMPLFLHPQDSSPYMDLHTHFLTLYSTIPNS